MKSYVTAREALISSAMPSARSARELAALTDDAVRELARAASSPVGGARIAVVALGGWGAGALQPTSDLDLLILSDGSADALKPYVEAVLYPLWDAGLDVGHQVRSPREQLRAMRSDLQTCTAALTGRPLAGDAAWANRLLSGAAADARKHTRSLLSQLHERQRPGSPYLLEPDLKDGAGGRRDHDELTWTAAILSGRVRHDPAELVALELLTAEEYTDLSAAADTIAIARFELGRAGAGALMTLDAAEALAAVDATSVQRALAQTALMLARVRERLARGGAHSRPSSNRQASASSASSASATTPLTPGDVFELLGAGEPSIPALELAAQAGRLDGLLPGFRDLMTARRPGLGHQLTVGAHSLRTAALAANPPTGGSLASSREALGDPRVLHVAALAHDVGKSQSGTGHAERGALSAHDAALRFGLSVQDADDVADLVRHHLLLAETATRADLDDEDAILSAAAVLGRSELLAPLHLLTAADSRATGPAAWSTWKAVLVGTLVARLDAALSDEVDGAGIVSRAEAVRAAALAATGDTLDAEAAFIELAPLRYLANRTPAEVTAHARLVASLSATAGSMATHIAVAPGPTPDTDAVTVVAADKPELLARIAGAMALAGLDILAVDAYGAPGGIALDTFVVKSATRRPVTIETFANLDRLLTAALHDRLQLRTRLAERRRHYPASATGPLTVRAVSSGFDTAVLVKGPDRPGLLHDLAAAVSATGLNIRWAKVVTVDGVVSDTFHVVDSEGGPVADDGVIGHLVMRLREVG